MARSPSPADRHHYAHERPQREAAGQRHSRKTHARTASLREEFASRFAGVRPLAADFKLFTTLFDIPVDDATAPREMELVELQYNDELLHGNQHQPSH